MENQVTVRDVIEGTINMLGNIAVPRNLNEQIGVPIDRAISNLRECINAFDRADEAARQAKVQEEPEEEPEGEAIEIGGSVE